METPLAQDAGVREDRRVTVTRDHAIPRLPEGSEATSGWEVGGGGVSNAPYPSHSPGAGVPRREHLCGACGSGRRGDMGPRPRLSQQLWTEGPQSRAGRGALVVQDRADP